MKVYEGEKLGIIGCNGFEQSTIMKLLSGIIGQDIGRAKVKPELRAAQLLSIGVGMEGSLSGRENAILNGILLRNSERLYVKETGEYKGVF